MRYRVPALLCALLVVAVTVGALPASAQPEAEETRLEVQIQPDGDARWTLVAVIELEDEAELERFRSFANAYESGQRDFELGVDVFRRAAREASAATGREMSIHSTEREAVVMNETEDGEVTSRYSELRVSFTWESFARVGENGTIRVGDAFNTTDGTWLPGLEENQTLVIKSPEGYGGPSTAPIGAEDDDLRWEGPRTFEPGYFEIVYQSAGPVSAPDDPVSTILLAGAILLSAAALLVGLYLLWGRRRGADDPTTARPDAGANGRGTDSAGAAPDAPASLEDVDEELLSDEELVEHLLERNGGRMKQASIVKETGWSNAKVSQLLSSMEESDRVDKLRIGRENLISLPGESVGELGDAEES
jgi:hypothetical protein